jgi:hypothetical protein
MHDRPLRVIEETPYSSNTSPTRAHGLIQATPTPAQRVASSCYSANTPCLSQAATHSLPPRPQKQLLRSAAARNLGGREEF